MIDLNYGHDLVSAGLGAITTIGIEHSFARALRWRRSARFAKAWSFLCEPTVVVIPLVPNSPVLGSAGIGDLLAMTHVLRLAETHFEHRGQIEIVMVTNDSAFDADKHLVVIGGGHYNPLFRQMISELKVPLHFHDTDAQGFEEIRDEASTMIYKPMRDADGTLVKDTGIAVRARRSNRWVIIAAGSNTYGSEAAMRYLTSEAALRDLPLDCNAEMVVWARVHNHAISEVEPVSPMKKWS